MEKMINMMMKRYQMFVWLGLMLVVIAFVLSILAANSNATFFSADKATREAAGPGTALVAANLIRHSISTWVPAFKFLGLGIMLGAIIMALGSIIQTLRDLGTDVMSTWPRELNPGIPEKPRAAKVFPMIMMMGWLILIAGLIWALSVNSVVTSYWNHAIANELNAAQPGSALLAQLGLIEANLPWLGFFRLLGMSFLFTGITVALTVVIRTLQTQEKTLLKFLEVRSS